MWPPQKQLPPIKSSPRNKRGERNPAVKSTKAIAKAAASLTPEKMAMLNQFVAGRIMGLSMREAAIHAGVESKSAKQIAKRAWEMNTHPYVRKLYAEHRELVTREQLITFNEQLLDLKQIAFDQGLATRDRLTAHAQIAKNMGFEAATRVKADISAEVKAGVMFLPMVGSIDQWEAMAMEQQRKLREACKNDAGVTVVNT